MIQVEIRNFQAIEHAKLTIDGFSVLVGRSNIGKSALVRAIRSALTGAPVTDLVRHGPKCPRLTKGAKTCSCFVSVHILAPKFDLLWQKGDLINEYQFNGQKYEKVSQGTPEFLRSVVAPILIDGEKTLLQVADQFDPIFLLNQTGSVVADVLSDVSGLNCVNVAAKNADKLRREIVATRKVREKDVADLEAQLAQYKGLDEAIDQAVQAKKKFSKLEQKHGEIVQITCYQRAWNNIVPVVGNLLTVAQTELSNIQPLYDKQLVFNQLHHFYSRMLVRTNTVRSLLGADRISVPSIDVLSEAAVQYAKIHYLVTRLDAFQRWFDQYKGSMQTQLPVAPSKLQRDFQAIQNMAMFVYRQNAVLQSISILEANLDQASTTLSLVLEEIQEIGVCPTCGRPLHGTSPESISPHA